uniref:Uncharacterized protein n=1 Tax=Oryza glumipatula TaxID=40148 RepID=A0A0D9YBF6_9ORYZ
MAGCGARRAAREALAQLAVGQLGQGQEEDVLGREKEWEDGERKKKKKGRRTSTACSAERLSHVKSSTRTSSSRPAPWWRRSRMAAAVAVTSSPPRPSTSPRLSWSSWEADELEEAATAPRPSTARRRRPASPRAAIATSVEAVVLAPGRRPRSVRAEVVAIAPRPPPAEPAEPTAIAPRPPPAESVPKPPPAVAARLLPARAQRGDGEDGDVGEDGESDGSNFINFQWHPTTNVNCNVLVFCFGKGRRDDAGAVEKWVQPRQAVLTV